MVDKEAQVSFTSPEVSMYQQKIEDLENQLVSLARQRISDNERKTRKYDELMNKYNSEELYYWIITPSISRKNLTDEKINFDGPWETKFHKENIKGVWFYKHNLDPIRDYKRLMAIKKNTTKKFLIKFKDFSFDGKAFKDLIITGNDLLSIKEIDN